MTSLKMRFLVVCFLLGTILSCGSSRSSRVDSLPRFYFYSDEWIPNCHVQDSTYLLYKIAVKENRERILLDWDVLYLYTHAYLNGEKVRVNLPDSLKMLVWEDLRCQIENHCIKAFRRNPNFQHKGFYTIIRLVPCATKD